MIISDVEYEGLLTLRLDDPEAFKDRLKQRSLPNSLLGGDGNLYLVSADEVSRGAIRVGDYPLAMANRRDLLERIMVALSVEGCNGVIASADILEELAVLGALDDRIAVGTMNRAGIAGASWAMDDGHSAYGPQEILYTKLQAGKMLLRLHPFDVGTKSTIELCGRYVSALSEYKLTAIIEPMPFTTTANGGLAPDLSPERLIQAVAIANGLGSSSAYSWLKVPVTPEIHQVMAATTLPCLMDGAIVPGSEITAFSNWEKAMKIPNVRGLSVGRSMLYPRDGDVLKASRQIAQIVHG